MRETFSDTQRTRFGQSRKKTSCILSEDQISLFSDAEKEQDHKAGEPTEKRFTVMPMPERRKRTLNEMTEYLPAEDVLPKHPESQLICDKCGGTSSLLVKSSCAFVPHSDVFISNNLAENGIRPFAVG